MAESLSVSIILPQKPEIIFNAWLDSQAHGDFTGSPAKIDPTIGGAFTAWDGYITGVTKEIQPYTKIVQSWRTSEFPDESPNSILTIRFEEIEEGTLLSLDHREIPDGQSEDYRKGWEDYYFSPMVDYFNSHTAVD